MEALEVADMVEDTEVGGGEVMEDVIEVGVVEEDSHSQLLDHCSWLPM